MGAATQNLLLAAHALGYGTFWRTGALAYDRGVMDALGRDLIIIETVGVGQGEVAIAGLADTTLLLEVPGRLAADRRAPGQTTRLAQEL